MIRGDLYQKKVIYVNLKELSRLNENYKIKMIDLLCAKKT